MAILAMAKATMMRRPTAVVMFFQGSLPGLRRLLFTTVPHIRSRVSPREYDETEEHAG